jgi:hypothetical protein
MSYCHIQLKQDGSRFKTISKLVEIETICKKNKYKLSNIESVIFVNFMNLMNFHGHT